MVKRAKVKEHTVVVMKEQGPGYWVLVPSLPGCYTTGGTVDEALRTVKEAIESHIIALEEDGQEVPTETSSVVSKVKVTV